MSEIPPLAREALELARNGQIAPALAAANKAIDANPDDRGLRLFVATLHSRRNELEKALPHLRVAVELQPSDPIARIELVRLLIGLDRLDEAEQHHAQLRIGGGERLRLQAMILARRNEPNAAARIFRDIVAADPRDHESWGNLGTSLLAVGQAKSAAEAFTRALELRPDLQKFREKLMEAQVEAGDGEEALGAMHRLVVEQPDNPSHKLAAARMEQLLGRPERAVELVRELVAIQPANVQALVMLAKLLERDNRIEESDELIARIREFAPDTPELGLMTAQLALRRGDLERALMLTEQSSPTVDRRSRAELLGKIHDRMGDSEAAFAAFTQMNRESDLSPAIIAARAQGLRDLIDQRASITTSEWVSGWRPGPVSATREPIFLIGFPRSGTTLLDTFLTGHPQLCVVEEKPMLEEVSRELGDYKRLAELDDSAIAALRRTYSDAASRFASDLGDRILVDKFPLGAIQVPLIHRLFPRAKIIFSIRHPCDVILSCFVTAFQPTPTMVSFYTLDDSAKLYDRVMRFWTQCRNLMPLDVHETRYENLVANPEAEMRSLLAFLEVQWDGQVLDHERLAGERSFVASASYAQVVEPLHDRSVGRWQRYRKQLEPVLPILEPWAIAFGYGSLQV